MTNQASSVLCCVCCGRIQQCLIGFRGKVHALEALWSLSLEPTCTMAARQRSWWIVSWLQLSG